MKVLIETIPHEQQRYPTVGDWQYEQGSEMEGRTLHIRVSRMTNWRFVFLVAIHEFVEAILCDHAGVSEQEVDAFDIKFEEDRKAGKHAPQDEPGDDVNAPYYQQHQIASGIERIMAASLNVDWNEYAEEVESL